MGEATAAAQAKGLISAEHVAVIGKFHKELPGWVDVGTRETADTRLAALAAGLGPEDLDEAAGALLMMIDQDGPEPSEEDHARKRGFHIGKQQRDGMSKVTGCVTPEGRRCWTQSWRSWPHRGCAIPIMRSLRRWRALAGAHQLRCAVTTQRNHDALIPMGRMALRSGELGQHNGLPVTVIVSTTLQELESGAGLAVTGSGSRLPMRGLIPLASHAHQLSSVVR